MVDEPAPSAALEAKLDRMMELMQQEFVHARAEFRAEMSESRAEFRAQMSGFQDETNGRFSAIDRRFDELRVEMAERFQSVMDRLDLLERQVARNSTTLQEMRAELDGVRSDMLKLHDQADRMQKSVNRLSDDMRQRFRVVNERLAAVEKRLAA